MSAIRAVAVLLALLPQASLAGEFGPATPAAIQPLLAPGETIESIEHAWFPLRLGGPGTHPRAGVLVLTSQRMLFLPFRDDAYWPGVVIPWDRLACGWVQPLGPFADRLLAVQARDGSVQTFTIGSGTLAGTLAGLARIDAHVGTGVDDPDCLVVRAEGPFRHAPSGITLPANGSAFERQQLRRASGGHDLSAEYAIKKGHAVVLTLRAAAGTATLAEALTAALANYRARAAPHDWRETPPTETEIFIGGTQIRALGAELASDGWLPDRHRVAVARIGEWLLVVDSGYMQHELKSAERQTAALLASVALPVTPPSP